MRLCIILHHTSFLMFGVSFWSSIYTKSMAFELIFLCKQQCPTFVSSLEIICALLTWSGRTETSALFLCTASILLPVSRRMIPGCCGSFCAILVIFCPCSSCLQVKWMMYWIVFALFTTAETATDLLLSWWVRSRPSFALSEIIINKRLM